ncbi:SET domain-containing protein SmydA-8-like [Ctenocephalides felis]|uniref:SET domain-containing protein SmydA-8-like n=1 Tax=Ctenocephalides felis TaxID=7515 RepID=UPI000E6E41E0|nr:SET domain-containing protein SmydA-8-like [Ctenocephalides felis]
MSVFKDHYLKKHLSENCQILLRPDGERGIFASQDLKSGDLLFQDRPLLLGPKNAVTAVQCSCCYKSNADLKPCRKGCSLPLCEDCSKDKEEHEQDCTMLRNLGICDTNSWSLNVLRALTPLRALRLQEKDKNVLKLLKSLKNISTRDELDSFLRLLDNPNIIDVQDIEFMHQVCSILQTNSFEVPVVNCGVEISYIRGIYPMAAMLNHSCAPNVRHSFVKEKAEDSVKGGVQFSPILEFRARQDVKCGEELFITYCDITDVTSVRLKKLSLTKGFLCKCPRCSDRTEFGTNISAFKCANQDKDCAGMMLPQEPLKLSTDYICISCNFILNKDLVEDYQKSATALLATLKNGQLDKDIKKDSNGMVHINLY